MRNRLVVSATAVMTLMTISLLRAQAAPPSQAAAARTRSGFSLRETTLQN